MAIVSGGQALSVGFGILRQAPLALAAWVAFDVVVGFLPSFLLRALTGSDPTGMAVSSGPILLLTLPLALLTVTVMMSAGFRAILQPDDSRYFYLRLSGQELWVAAALIALLVIWMLGFFIALIPLGIVVGVVAGLAGAASGGGGILGTILLGVVMYVAVFALAIWGFMRLSLMLPFAFAERRIAIADAWRLSKGNVWQMVGAWLVIFVIALCAYLVLFAAIFGSLIGSTPLSQLPQVLQDDPTALQRASNPGLLVVLGLVLVVLNTGLRAAFSGAWADIYRQVKRAPDADVFA